MKSTICYIGPEPESRIFWDMKHVENFLGTTRESNVHQDGSGLQAWLGSATPCEAAPMSPVPSATSQVLGVASSPSGRGTNAEVSTTPPPRSVCGVSSSLDGNVVTPEKCAA